MKNTTHPIGASKMTAVDKLRKALLVDALYRCADAAEELVVTQEMTDCPVELHRVNVELQEVLDYLPADFYLSLKIFPDQRVRREIWRRRSIKIDDIINPKD
jgi:hypothetical protein